MSTGEKLRSGCAARIRLCLRSRLARSSGLGNDGGCVIRRSGVIGPIVNSFAFGGVLVPPVVDGDRRMEKRRPKEDGLGEVSCDVPDEGAVIGLAELGCCDAAAGVLSVRRGEVYSAISYVLYELPEASEGLDSTADHATDVLFDLKLAGIESVVVDSVVVEVPRTVLSESHNRRAARREDVAAEVAVLDDRRCCNGGACIRLGWPSAAKS